MPLAAYRVTSAFTILRRNDHAPKHLKEGWLLQAREPLGDPIIVQIGEDEFESDADAFQAHTVREARAEKATNGG